MITFFCPSCWKEIKKDNSKCPFCRADITEHEKRSFEDKLINALNHPERETVQRAVWILGRIGSVAAVRPLIALFNETSNPFLKTAILNAMGEIGTPEAMDLIVKSINSEMSMVKLRAREIVEQVWGAREKK